MNYRNTPSEGLGSSPAQRLFGRRTNTLVPTSSRLMVPEAVHGVPHKLKEGRAKEAYYYDRVAKELDRLKLGDVVRVKLRPDSKEWTKAAVDKEVDIRSYQVRTEVWPYIQEESQASQTNQRAIPNSGICGFFSQAVTATAA